MKIYYPMSEILKDPHPQVVGVVADPNQGKTNTLHAIAQDLRSRFEINVVTYGVPVPIKGARQISSVRELESTKNSLIFLDEFYSLFQLNTNRRNFELIEKSIRMIYHPHHNNILMLVGIPQNFNKFISGKLTKILFKRCTLVDFINGSAAKGVCYAYGESELGASIINVQKDELLMWDSEAADRQESAYKWIKVPYIKEADYKRFNQPIFTPYKLPKDIKRRMDEIKPD